MFRKFSKLMDFPLPEGEGPKMETRRFSGGISIPGQQKYSDFCAISAATDEKLGQEGAAAEKID